MSFWGDREFAGFWTSLETSVSASPPTVVSKDPVSPRNTGTDPEGTDSGGRRYYPVLKRGFDVVFALVGILLFLPFGAVIAILVRLSDGGPVFYRQIRVGQGGKPFQILKFRSMVMNADKVGPSVTKDRDPRITRIGRFLRRTKLDEMPQLWNVLVGEMSFVGPRPEVPRYVERYTPEQRRLLDYKPGITDLATLVFRDEETLLKSATNVEEFYVAHCIPRKFNLNIQYARRANLLEDVFLILETLCPYWVGVASGYLLALGLSLWISYQLRFDFDVPAEVKSQMKVMGLVVLPIQMGCLVWRRQFAGLLSYFDVPEMKQLASGLALASGLQFVIWYVTQGDWMIPRSMIVMHAVMAFMMIAGVRMGLRSWREVRSSRNTVERHEGQPLRMGIIGAGEMGAWIARQVNGGGGGNRRVLVFFDDDSDKWNMRLCDVPVVGMPECIADGSWSESLDEVVVAMPSATPERHRQIQTLLRNAKLRSRTMPSLQELLSR